ncbi:MAG: hypothetical protein EBT09_15075, partial [Actinobacteria bacterium]|nr:hypothetical protein [Actinomycetota bacterium]
RDAINAAGGNITASIKNGKLRLESNAAVSTVFANETSGGALASTLFATNATSNTTSGTTTLEDLGITAAGTLTIVAGVDAGTSAAAGTIKLDEIGVTAAGTLTIAFANAGGTETRSVAVTYATSDTLSALETRINTAVTDAAGLTASGNTTNGMAVTWNRRSYPDRPRR